MPLEIHAKSIFTQPLHSVTAANQDSYCCTNALCVKQCNYKRSKVCKSKPNGEKLLKFCKNDFFEEKTWTNCAFLGKKTKGWSHKLEILDEDNFSPVQKNLEFVAAALHCEFYISNIQIFSKYFHNLDEQKYFDSVFKGYG